MTKKLNNDGHHPNSRKEKVFTGLEKQLDNPVLEKRMSKPSVSFECRTCGQQFRHKGHWLRHEVRHNPEHITRFSTEDKPSLEKCKESCKNNNESDGLDAKQASEKTHLLLNKEKLSQKELKDICHNESPKNQSKKSDAKPSKSLKQKVAKRQGLKPKDCSMCHKSFQSHAKLVDHLNWHRGQRPFSCSMCYKTFWRKDNLQKHQRIHARRTHSCSSCSESFGRQHDLRLHKVHAHGAKIILGDLHQQQRPVSHMKKDKLKKSCLCQYCGTGFKNKSAVQNHESKVHQGLRLQCEDCNKRFANRSSLITHMLIHLGVTPYQCETCQECFSSSAQLRKHERVHSGLHLHQECPECGRLFSHADQLKMHLHTHTGHRPYKCYVCGKTFSHPSTLRTHKRIHTGAKPFRCELCKMAFSQRSSLRYHMNSHRGERPFSCHICGNSYTRMATLNIHLTRHTGVKRVACPLCDFTCDTPKHLRKHAAKVHPGVQVKPMKTQPGEVQRRPDVLYAAARRGPPDVADKLEQDTSLSKGESCADTYNGCSHMSVAKEISTCKIDNSTCVRNSFKSGICYSGQNDNVHVATCDPASETVDKSAYALFQPTEDKSLRSQMTVSSNDQPQQTRLIPNIVQASNHIELAQQNGHLSMSIGTTLHESTKWKLQSQSQPTLLPQTAYSIDDLGLDHNALPEFQNEVNHWSMATSSDRCQNENPELDNQRARHSTSAGTNNPTASSIEQSLASIKSSEYVVPSIAHCFSQPEIDTDVMSLAYSRDDPMSSEESVPVCSQQVHSGSSAFVGKAKHWKEFTEDSSDTTDSRSCLSNINLVPNKQSAISKRAARQNGRNAMPMEDLLCGQIKEEFETSADGDTLNNGSCESRYEQRLSTNEESISSEDRSNLAFKVEKEELHSVEQRTVENCGPVSTTNEGRVHNTRQSSKGRRKMQWTVSLERCKTHESNFSTPGYHKIVRNAVGKRRVNKRKRSSIPEDHIKTEIVDESFTEGKTAAQHSSMRSRGKKAHSTNKQTELICAQCGKVETALSDLEKHVNEAHAGLHPYCCKICSFSSLVLDHLKVHTRSEHKRRDSGPFKYQCELCSKVFYKPSEIKDHMESTHPPQSQREQLNKNGKVIEDNGNRNSGPFKCGECGQLYRCVTNLTNHMTRKHSEGERFKCGMCQVSFFAPAELEYHMLSHNGRRPSKCDECGKSFFDERQLRKHNFIHVRDKLFKKKSADGQSTGQRGSEFRNDIQDKQDGQVSNGGGSIKREDLENDLAQELIDNLPKSKKPAACPICGRMLAGNVAKHMRVHSTEKPYVCSKCGKGFPRSDNLHNHMKRAHSSPAHPNPELLNLSCSQCGEYKIDLGQLEKHANEAHDGVRPFCCNLCGFSSLLLIELKLHVKAKHQDRNLDSFRFQCALCSKIFTKSFDVKNHVKSTHTALEQDQSNNISPYKCGECGLAYQKHTTLYHHMAKKHSGANRFKCGVCHTTFFSAPYLGDHMLSHNGQRNYMCDQCGKGFPDVRRLRKHFIVHTDRMPYKCADCGRLFKHLYTLRLHKNTHTGHKPHKCKKCGSAFSQLSSLTSHMKSHLGLKPYMCQICGNSYTRVQTLYTHMNHHKGLRKFKCQLCDYMTDKSYHMTKHMAKIHPGES